MGKKFRVELNFMELILFIDMIHSHRYPKPHDYLETAEIPTNIVKCQFNSFSFFFFLEQMLLT